ncbi:MAG: exonuclease SbcCD subunit D [Candidatus Binatia bacterium]|nr:exonuclease SbcCD subunit D [Candidatus Binatia bacterium]
MRFLHTADWHVGRTIRHRSRLDEHRAVLDEIIDIATREHVDAVCVTGDVFHERRPPLDAQELVAETFAELARRRIPVVVIPGNHDDPVLLRTLKPLGDLVQVHIMSDFSEHIATHIIRLPGRDGRERALIGCLPYLHPHLVVSAAEGAGMSEAARLSTYQAKIQDYLRALAETMQRQDRQAVRLILAHLHIAECEFGGGEWRSSVFPVNAAMLPPHTHYVALGHLHKPQAVPGAKAQAWYAGSILQMDFGEREQQKSVCVLEAQAEKPATIAPVPLSKGKWLLRRHGTAAAVLAQVADCRDAWVEAVLQPDGSAPELVERLRALPHVIAVRFADLPFAEERDRSPQQGLKERPATDLFREYYKTKRQADPAPELVELFARLYQEVSGGSEEPPS